MVPDNWQTFPFDEIASNKSTKYDPTRNVTDFLCVELEHLSQETGLILGAVSSKNMGSIKNKFSTQDVLFGKLRPYLKKFAKPDFEGVCSSEIWVLRPSKRVTRDFLYYLVQSHRFVESANKSIGSKMPRADWCFISQVGFDLPPLLEQKKISEILSTWDKSIEATERLLENSKKRKKALMQRLLTGKKRLPGFDDDWQQFVLGDFFERSTNKNSELNSNVVTISGARGFINQRDYFNKQVASENLENYFLIEKGQFAYNKSYSNGYPMGAIKRLNNFEKAVVTTLYICFSIKDDIGDSNFFEHFFESGILNRGLTQICQEGARDHGLLNVKPSDFFSLRFFVPSKSEQQAIAQILECAAEEVVALEKRLKILLNEKRSLMQQLLTGKKRVKIDHAA